MSWLTEAKDTNAKAIPTLAGRNESTKEHTMKVQLCGYVVAAVLIAAGSSPAFADGAAVYNANCAACHNNMKPKIGDKDAWAPLIKEGTDALVASTIKGKGMMPPQPKEVLNDQEMDNLVGYLRALTVTK